MKSKNITKKLEKQLEGINPDFLTNYFEKREREKERLTHIFKDRSLKDIEDHLSNNPGDVIATDSFDYRDDPTGYYAKLSDSVYAFSSSVIDYFQDKGMVELVDGNYYVTNYCLVKANNKLFEVTRMCGQGTIDCIRVVSEEAAYKSTIVDISTLYKYYSS